MPVSENARTIQAVQALENNDLNRFGRLMNASHQSLRDDYEVTGDELDALVEAAWDTEGVLGSRMTGAGFGGCTISLVRTEAVDNFIKNVGRIYRQQIGYPADLLYLPNRRLALKSYNRKDFIMKILVSGGTGYIGSTHMCGTSE